MITISAAPTSQTGVPACNGCSPVFGSLGNDMGAAPAVATVCPPGYLVSRLVFSSARSSSGSSGDAPYTGLGAVCMDAATAAATNSSSSMRGSSSSLTAGVPATVGPFDQFHALACGNANSDFITSVSGEAVLWENEKELQLPSISAASVKRTWPLMATTHVMHSCRLVLLPHGG